MGTDNERISDFHKDSFPKFSQRKKDRRAIRRNYSMKMSLLCQEIVAALFAIRGILRAVSKTDRSVEKIP